MGVDGIANCLQMKKKDKLRRKRFQKVNDPGH